MSTLLQTVQEQKGITAVIRFLPSNNLIYASDSTIVTSSLKM